MNNNELLMVMKIGDCLDTIKQNIEDMLYMLASICDDNFAKQAESYKEWMIWQYDKFMDEYL